MTLTAMDALPLWLSIKEMFYFWKYRIKNKIQIYKVISQPLIVLLSSEQ